MYKTITHRELRNNSSAVLRAVELGETLEVTNRGEVVALLMPAGAAVLPRVIPATVTGGFGSLERFERAESVEVALRELREE